MVKEDTSRKRDGEQVKSGNRSTECRNFYSIILMEGAVWGGGQEPLRPVRMFADDCRADLTSEGNSTIGVADPRRTTFRNKGIKKRKKARKKLKITKSRGQGEGVRKKASKKDKKKKQTDSKQSREGKPEPDSPVAGHPAPFHAMKSCLN